MRLLKESDKQTAEIVMQHFESYIPLSFGHEKSKT